jgi:FaeA-like protein
MSDATHFWNAINSAYDAGHADGARKAEILARIQAEASGHWTVAKDASGYFQAIRNPGIATSAVIKKKKALIKAEKGKSATIARGVKRPAKPREKGVKDGIISYMRLTGGGLTINDIIEKTGFKESSVRGTLMQMKKKGAVSCQGRGAETLWSLATAKNGDGASDEARA